MPIDDRTTNRSYQLPNAGNLLAEDVVRLRAALAAIDADMANTLEVKAPLASPALTGAPTAPTPTPDSNSTRLATTAFVIAQAYLKAATAAATYAPLESPVFTGSPRLPSINAGPLAGFRNAVINGNFDIWQLATTHSVIGYGSVDRWRSLGMGSSSTISQQAFTLGQADVPNNPRFFCRAVVTSVTGASNYLALGQFVEGVCTFAGRTVTVSFWAKADASRSIAVELVQGFGTGGSPSVEVNAIGSTKVAINTTWQQVTVTATLPSITGKTLGTDNND
jgi:hypothetical protein